MRQSQKNEVKCDEVKKTKQNLKRPKIFTSIWSVPYTSTNNIVQWKFECRPWNWLKWSWSLVSVNTKRKHWLSFSVHWKNNSFFLLIHFWRHFNQSCSGKKFVIINGNISIFNFLFEFYWRCWDCLKIY